MVQVRAAALDGENSRLVILDGAGVDRHGHRVNGHRDRERSLVVCRGGRGAFGAQDGFTGGLALADRPATGGEVVRGLGADARLAGRAKPKAGPLDAPLLFSYDRFHVRSESSENVTCP